MTWSLDEDGATRDVEIFGLTVPVVVQLERDAFVRCVGGAPVDDELTTAQRERLGADLDDLCRRSVAVIVEHADPEASVSGVSSLEIRVDRSGRVAVRGEGSWDPEHDFSVTWRGQRPESHGGASEGFLFMEAMPLPAPEPEPASISATDVEELAAFLAELSEPDDGSTAIERAIRGGDLARLDALLAEAQELPRRTLELALSRPFPEMKRLVRMLRSRRLLPNDRALLELAPSDEARQWLASRLS